MWRGVVIVSGCFCCAGSEGACSMVIPPFRFLCGCGVLWMRELCLMSSTHSGSLEGMLYAFMARCSSVGGYFVCFQ